MKTKDQLEEELKALNIRITTLEAALSSEQDHGSFDKALENATKLTPLYRKRNNLTDFIAAYEVHEDRIQKVEAKRAAAQERLRAVKPGDVVILGTGNTVRVRRVNKKTITSDSGVLWTYGDLVDVL